MLVREPRPPARDARWLIHRPAQRQRHFHHDERCRPARLPHHGDHDPAATERRRSGGHGNPQRPDAGSPVIATATWLGCPHARHSVDTLSLSPPGRRNILARAAAAISCLFPDLDSIGGPATARALLWATLSTRPGVWRHSHAEQAN